MVCPRCDDLCPAGSTVCDCGCRLTLSVPELLAVRDAGRPRCTCGDAGICTYCVLQSYESGALA